MGNSFISQQRLRRAILAGMPEEVGRILDCVRARNAGRALPPPTPRRHALPALARDPSDPVPPRARRKTP